MMDRIGLQNRTKKFHIDIIRLCSQLPKTAVGYETAKQLIRSAGSVGANYRASARAKSTNDFINKLKIIIEEADEAQYWLEIIRDAPLIKNSEDLLNGIIKEANELTAIFVASNKTVIKNKSLQTEQRSQIKDHKS
jgi:four helix bundle protein